MRFAQHAITTVEHSIHVKAFNEARPTPAMVTWNPRNIIATAVLLSALVAGLIGLGVAYAYRPAPAAQTRDSYLVAVDQTFNSSLAMGLIADYDFSPHGITV